jgi:hypothetical protein
MLFLVGISCLEKHTSSLETICQAIVIPHPPPGVFGLKSSISDAYRVRSLQSIQKKDFSEKVSDINKLGPTKGTASLRGLRYFLSISIVAE